MWGDPDPDPGGQAPGPQPSREIKDLKDQNEQQQVLIAQLKEMLRKEQSTVPQEKVEEYINTLSKAKAKKSRLKKDDSGSVEKNSGSSMDSNKNEKVNLMKQQMEENRAKLAERGMRQKDIEDMVTVLKAQLNDSSQQLINSAPVNLSSIEKNLDYNKNTGPEELYNILLVKEKKITDLLERVQKQEANILDLQENLKEKDSVLDARTKAISLMSENLSKKGKDTLDALDETKEQMRKMQENFITLESEMKARQMILLNDLKSKNLEIADLKDENKIIVDKLTCNEKPESDNHELLIKDLKSKLDESKTTIEEFRNKINEFEKKNGQNQNNELEKLKKQLDDSNKNMIKVKAQHKSKIKDLNKKLDGFKKMSDANATIIQLQTETTKLNEKIAELEEEKGNMQLKMVESIESIKGSINSEDLKELQEKLDRNIEETEEKDKIISLLESDIISLKSEIKNLNDKISGFSQLKNEQVTSEIQSIQIEEQLEILETSNKELLVEIESLRKEKEGFVEKIEELIKEKLELTTKLDNYIQENMELIDKLEKLSAEKVSSAESIEIVENLTQQEKLELAAYQKNMDPNLEYPIKRQEEEPPAELNESVLQLTEETTELLKKIEMFNMERKEVMIKLEALREENNQLSLKLNEVENNRDILAETYEQVQTEKDDLVKENEKMVQQLKNLENITHPQGADTSTKLQLLQTEYEKILEENDNHKKSLKQLDAKIHEKDNLESELFESKRKLNELESKLNENLEEITNYQSIIEENKMEFINSSNIINQLQSKLEERETDIKELNDLINDLNNIVTNLQEDNSRLDNLEEMEKQVDQFKISLNVQTEEFKEEIIKKDREIERLKEKDQTVNSTIEEMKQKYITLQEQLNSNSGTLDKQIEELSNKNKEQLEKMKKIAANLKKKTKALQELEEKYKEETEKLETDLSQFSTENIQLKEEISTKTLIMEQLETRIEELTKHKQEISLKQELSTSFYEEFDGSKESINEDKIKEMQLIIETNEADLQHYKERSEMLEEDLARLLEEKEHLLSKSTQLETKFNLLSQSVEEKSLLEQEMDHKLQEVTANDEILVQRIDEVTKENKELTDKNRDQEELIVKLKIKIKKVQDKINQNKMLQANLEEQEHINNGLKQQLIHLETVLKQNQIEYEEKQKENQKDYERIESDYQLQLEELVKCRNDLTFECEKLQEDVKILKEREEELLMEVNESMKIIDDLRGQILNETAKNTVEDVITEAKVTVNTEVNVTKEDLENKIKALEILLYNVDQEKEEVIQECSDMLNELTRLVYEKVQLAGNTNLSTAPSVGSLQPLSDLESQVLSPEDIADPLKLHQLEFEETDISLGQQNYPVEDKVGAPTKAYLTYQPTELESQILHSEDIETLNDPLKLQQLEFERCDPLLGQQSRPVVEKLAQPSKAYLTYQVGEAIGENDDGWGWGPEEARLEAEHQYRAENTPQVQALKAEVEELKENLQTLQIKYGKLVKLCKELKVKLATKSKDKFFDLDETIQEELKTQIEQLEAKTKELTAELEKEKYDRSNLLKRVDVLTLANEKMLEMNQIQDSEIYRWKRKYDEIQKKLDWDNNSPKNEPTEDVPEDIEELKKLVQDLTVDNEELQALLNDQKQQRTQLERSKSINNEERIKNLEESILDKDAMINKLTEEKQDFERIQQGIKNLEADILDKDMMINKLTEEKLELQQKNNDEKIKILEEDILNKQLQNEELQNEKIDLVNQFQQSNEALNREIFSLRQELDNLTLDSINPVIQELTQFKANSIKELIEHFNQACDNFENIKALEEKLLNQKQQYEELQFLTAKNILDLQNDTETNIKVLKQELFNQNQRYEDLQVLTSKNILELQTELEELKYNNDTGKNIKALEEELFNQKQQYENLQVLMSKNILELQTELEEHKQKNDKILVQEFDQKQDKLKEEIKIKQQIIDDMETKLVETITELEKNWAAQVDERGNTVAESWKYHLSVVESDFASIQDKLKNEINELEEKCNVLVNENNELRKNVDTEIKNEVDRISALQQQITDRQHVINELKQLLAKEEMEKVDLVNELDKLQRVLADKETEFISLKTLAKQFDEKREVVEDIIKLLEKNTSFPLSCDKQDILNEIQRQIDEKDAEILRIKELKGQNDELELNTNQQIDQLKSQIKQKDEEFTALQQMVYQLNYTIEDYKQKLEEFNPAYASLQSIIDEKNQQIEQLKDEIKEIEHKNKDEARLLKEEYNVQLSTTQHEIQQKLQHFNMTINEKNQQIEQLKNQIEQKDENLARSKEEYTTAQQEILNLQQMYHNSNYAVEDYKQKLEEFNPAYASLQSTINEKNQQIEDQLKEIEQNNEIISELKETQQNLYHQVEDYKLKLEQLMQSYTSLQSNIEEKNQQINILNQQLQLATDNKQTEKLETELSQTKDAYIILQQSLADCQQQLFNITQDLATKSHEFETVTQQLLYSQQNVDILQEQINNLNQTLHIKEQEYTASIEKIESTHYKELENHYEEILSTKDLDIQTLRSQVAESVYNTSENLERIKQLEVQIKELSTIKAELETKMLEQTLLAEEESKQLNEMRGIIEEQVVKIEELKKELFEKSNDYDSLIAEMDISRKAITQQPTASGSRAENPSAVAERPTIPEDDLSEPVNRAELDLALYMLHQRDVRCEELTVELTHLLEERDTLQLRLSNAIREKEDFKRNMTDVTGSKEVKASFSEVSPETLKTSSEIFLGTELASEPSEKLTSGQELASKLSELKTVGYKKDKTFVDEQQQRRMQQISIMQQHIKEAAKLPPEAAAKLVDASYTLSRDVQSPSKVLLNWLWGRSTPRVNDT